MILAEPLRTATLVSALVLGSSGMPWAAEQGATPEEVVERTKQAAQQLAAEGEAALDEFRDRNSQYIWKDTYVFVVNCDEQEFAAHPINPQLEGTDITTLEDKAGRVFGAELCEAAQQPRGDWVEYQWPKPGAEEPARKFTYMLQAEGTPFAAGAGVYDEDATVEELRALTVEAP